MSASPQIIAIDDEREDLDGLANGLSHYGVPCYKIHFTGFGDIQACPDVRVIFADLNLGVGGLASGDFQSNFSPIGRVLEKIQPRGPYVIFLWTRHAAKASALKKFLAERLEGVAKPCDVRALAKAHHLDGTEVRDEESLVAEITSITEEIGKASVYDESYRVVKAALAPLFPDRTLPEHAQASKKFSGCPTPNEIMRRLKRLFSKGDGPYEEMPPGYPTEETTLEEWLDVELADFGQTPRQMLNSSEEGLLFLLDRFVNAIATSRALSHPRVVREIVRHRMEALFREAQDPGSLNRELQYELPDDVPGNLFERWMDLPNPMFGNVSPRQFFEDEDVDAERVLEISSLLDSIDDGAFS